MVYSEALNAPEPNPTPPFTVEHICLARAQRLRDLLLHPFAREQSRKRRGLPTALANERIDYREAHVRVRGFAQG
jgi:hypothetical protein